MFLSLPRKDYSAERTRTFLRTCDRFMYLTRNNLLSKVTGSAFLCDSQLRRWSDQIINYHVCEQLPNVSCHVTTEGCGTSCIKLNIFTCCDTCFLNVRISIVHIQRLKEISRKIKASTTSKCNCNNYDSC